MITVTDYDYSMSDLVTLSLTTLHFHHQITCLSPGAMWWMVAIFSVPLAIPLAALLMLVIAAKTHVLWMCVFWFLFCPLHKHHDHIFENLVIENNFFFSYFLFFILCFFSLVIAQTRYKESLYFVSLYLGHFNLARTSLQQ